MLVVAAQFAGSSALVNDSRNVCESSACLLLLLLLLFVVRPFADSTFPFNYNIHIYSSKLSFMCIKRMYIIIC